MQSADRALAILGTFSPERPLVRVSELASELGLHKSTVSRLLAILQARGLVRRDGDRFAPGPELARLGVLAVNGLPLVQAAREPLGRLAEKTGETVNVAVRRGEEAVNVVQVQTAHLVGMTDWTGRGAALHATANGKALLAFGNGSLPEKLPALTRRTITDRSTLKAELERAPKQGLRDGRRGAGGRAQCRRCPGLRRRGRVHRRHLGLGAYLSPAREVPARGRTGVPRRSRWISTSLGYRAAT